MGLRDLQAFVLDYAGLCGGRGSYSYPQHMLVADWAGQLQAALGSGAREAGLPDRLTPAGFDLGEPRRKT
jgi:hypothetical protein